jgi:hypothetical protein
MPMPARFPLLLLLLLAAPAAAQRRDDLTGKLVRVTAPNFADHVVTGTVSAYTEEGLRVAEQGSSAEHLYPLRSVQRIEIVRGAGAAATAPRRARGYGFIGFGIGVLAGPVLSLATDLDMVESTAITAGGGLVIGLAAGAASGAAAPRDQWSWVVNPWNYDPALRPPPP